MSDRLRVKLVSLGLGRRNVPVEFSSVSLAAFCGGISSPFVVLVLRSLDALAFRSLAVLVFRSLVALDFLLSVPIGLISGGGCVTTTGI